LGIREERFDRAAEMPHRKPAGDNRLDARLESGLGRLYFEGQITKDEYEAGVKYGNFVLLYLETIDGPDPYGGKSWHREANKGNALPGILEATSDKECFRRKINFAAARKVLLGAGGKRCAAIVDRIAIYDEPLRDGEMSLLRAGLVALCGN